MKAKLTLQFAIVFVCLFFGTYSNAQILKANFKLVDESDSITFCAPKQIQFINQSTLTDSAGKPLTTDSIITLIWTTGVGNTITKSYLSNTLTYTYIKNGNYDVSLKVITAKGLKNSLIRKSYVQIIGPKVKFQIIGDSIGYAPFTVKFRVILDKSDSTYIFNFENCGSAPNCTNSALTNRGADSLISFTYVNKGIFHPWLIATDTFRDLQGHKLPECSLIWPPDTTLPSAPQIVVKDTLSGIGLNQIKTNANVYIDGANQLRIHLTNPIGIINFKLYDVAGRELCSGFIPSGVTDFVKDLSEYPNGIVLLTMQTYNDSYTTKIGINR